VIFPPPQVVTKPEFDFTHAPIFRNVTIAAWDPGKYNGTLEDWLTSADYDLFTNYEIYRRRYPKSRAFLIDPHSVWRLWQSLQMFAGNRPISRNPPSSGFIGELWQLYLNTERKLIVGWDYQVSIIIIMHLCLIYRTFGEFLYISCISYTLTFSVLHFDTLSNQ